MSLAKQLKTKVMVCKDRWKRLEQMGIAHEYFILYHDHKAQMKLIKASNSDDKQGKLIENEVYLHMKPMG